MSGGAGDAPGGDRLLDLRGMRCPWPALRVGRALRDGDAPLLAVADDPAAPAEIGAVAAARGWSVAPVRTPLGAGLRLERSGAVADRRDRRPTTSV